MVSTEIVVFTTLLSLEVELSTVFVRVHKSYLVNISQITIYNKKEGGSLKLTNGASIPVSRKRRPSFLLKIGL